MSPRIKTIFHFFGSFLLLGTLPMLLDSAQTPMGHWGQTTLRTQHWGQRHWGQTTLRTGDVEDRRRWGQIHPPIHFPTLGPKGPQKPSNLHIFSNVGSIYPIKYVHSPNRNPQNYIFSPNVGSIYPIKTFIPQVLASYIQYFRQILNCLIMSNWILLTFSK